MKVTIRAFARFKDIFGEINEITLPESASLSDALSDFATGFPDGSGALFSEDGAVHPYIFVMVNRVRIPEKDISSQVLSEGDEVVIYPPVSGG
ncbi:MAG: MoaD/ThiS family protein [Methanospirillaceae archaeon]|nr:MoaD/ThiS family protein [Methanospirillaceae archaeon]